MYKGHELRVEVLSYTPGQLSTFFDPGCNPEIEYKTFLVHNKREREIELEAIEELVMQLYVDGPLYI
jgi:hypothetical protein